MSQWNELPTTLINQIGEYIPPSRFFHIALTCKPWYNALLPQIYKILPAKIWTKSNCKKIIENYGSHFKVLEKCEDFGDYSNTLTDLLKHCPNIQHLNITQQLLIAFKGLQLDEIFPHLESITFDQQLDNVQLISELNRLNSLQFYWNELGYIQRNTPSSLYGQIRRLYLSIPEFDFDELKSILTKFTNINHFYFLVSSDDSIPHDHVPDLLALFDHWKSLESLNITINLNNLIFSNESIDDFQIEFPENFSIHQLKYFSIDIQQENMVQIYMGSSDEDDAPNHRSIEDSINFNANINPKIFNNLFNHSCDRLTRLHLAIIDSKLLDIVSHSCPKLIQLTMDSPLPIPTASTITLPNLKKLSTCGFFHDAFAHKNVYIHLFPKVTVFSLETEIYSSWDDSAPCHLYIFEFFKNITSIVFNFNEDEIDDDFWRNRVPSGFQLRQIVILASYFDRLVAWLELNKDFIESPFTVMIDLTDSIDSRSQSDYNCVTSRFPSIDFFFCKSSDRFEFHNIILV